MDSPENYNKILQDIFRHHTFERLESFKDLHIVKRLNKEERYLLSHLFLLQGNHQLQCGQNEVVSTFDWAAKVSPDPSKILFEQALACLKSSLDEENVNCLSLGIKKLEGAISLDPNYTEAFHLWGNLLVRLGISHQESNYYLQADEKYTHVASSYKECPEKLGPLYWDWGLCWHQLGNLSTEAVDYNQAITYYSKALNLGFKAADFLLDYANAMVEMGRLLKDLRWLEKAVDFYQQSLAINPDAPATYFHLSQILSLLYEYSSQEKYYKKALEVFQTAANYDPERVELWLSWGKFFAIAGLKKGDLRCLAQSVDCYTRADHCHKEDPLVLAHWGETLVYMASFTDDIECLKEAEERITTSLKHAPDNIETWVIYARCLLEYGRYFHEDNYIHQAMSYFQKAIKANANDEHAYRGLAVAYSMLGEMYGDYSLYERALEVYAQCEQVQHHPEELYEEWGTVLLKLSELSNRKEYIEGAIEKFEKSLAIQKEKNNLNIEILYNYGCALDYLGDYYETGEYYYKAVQVLSRVLVIDPGFSHARYNLALALSHYGETKVEIKYLHQAIEHFKILSKEDPEDDMAWHDWGVTLITLSQIIEDPTLDNQSIYFMEEAEEKLVKAASLGNVQAIYHLSCLYSLCGYIEKSLDMLFKGYAQQSLPSSLEMLQDTWLENVRNCSDFHYFIKKVQSQEE